MSQYRNLSNVQRLRLAVRYLINDETPKGEKELEKIIDFRARLLSILDLVLKGKSEKSRIVSELSSLVMDIRDDMKSATDKTIMKKLLFISALGEELQDYNIALSKEVKDRLAIRDLTEQTTAIVDFVRYAASDALLEDNFYNELILKNAKNNVEMLKKKLDEKFMSFLSTEHPSPPDALLLMGYISQRRDALIKTFDSFFDMYCKSCNRDDCMTPYCNYNHEKTHRANALSVVDNAFYALRRRNLKGEVTDYVIDQVYAGIKAPGHEDAELKDMVRKVMIRFPGKNCEPFYHRYNLTREEELQIVAPTLDYEANSRLSGGEDDIRDTNDVIMRIIMASGFDNCLGDKLHRDFVWRQLKFCDNIKKVKDIGRVLSYGEMIELYQKLTDNNEIAKF